MCCVFEYFARCILLILIPNRSAICWINTSIFSDVEIVKALTNLELRKVATGDRSLWKRLNFVFNVSKINISRPGEILRSKVHSCQIDFNPVVAYGSNIVVDTVQSTGRRQWTVEQQI